MNNSNLNNSSYRDFLMKNTNSIMKQNCQNPILNQVRVESMKIKTYPYLFNGINDNNQPYGYENSIPKQMYISHEKMDSQKRIPLKNDL